MLQFEPTASGLSRATVSTPLAQAEVYRHGAHVALWTPCGHKPVLFLSSRTLLEPGKAIRGGVPVIFPWFGPRSDGKPGPAHGFARTSLWTVDSTHIDEAGLAEIVLSLAPNDHSRELGFDAFHARFTVRIGKELHMELEVSNRGEKPLVFEEALHTYFCVSDVREMAIHGLEGTTYIDKTDAFSRKLRPAEPIRFTKETDQVHVNTEAVCTVEDPRWVRRIVIEKTGSRSTVVWNPWVAKTAALPDMAPDEWTGFVCVEAANAGENAVTLETGGSHRMTVAISVHVP